MNIRRCAVALLSAGVLSFTTYADAPSGHSVATDLGITPEALVLAGFTTQNAQTMLSRLESVSPMRDNLASARASADAAGRAVTRTAERLLRGDSDPDLPQIHAQNRSALASALAEVDHQKDLLFAVATSGLNAESAQRLIDLRATQHDGAPAEIRAASISDDDWHDVRLALIAERRAQRRGETLDQESATLLAEVRAMPAVQEAATDLSSGLTSMRSAFE